MSFSVIIMDSDEKFIQFLDPDLLTLTENHDTYGLRTLKLDYNIESIDEAQTLFRHGYKIWVSGDNSVTDCLYVINTNVEKDLFKENQVTLDAEEVLVELNYAYPFMQTDVTSANGFTIKKQNSQDYVKVNYYALNYWFGDYFQIGIVQDCLTVHASRIAPRGIMSKMELLRFIEEETDNVFRTRYEKDPQTNVIHRYLDFLNPDSSNTAWELFIDYTVPEADDGEATLIDENEDEIENEPFTPQEDMDGIEDEDDVVEFPKEKEITYYEPSELLFQLLDENNHEIGSWDGETIGVTTSQANLIRMAYDPEEGLTCQCNGKTFANISLIDNQETYTDFNDEDNYPFDSIADDPNKIDVILGNHSVFQVLGNNVVIHRQSINPLLGDVHNEVLDLGYNLENVKYDVDESDTFNAIMPILSLSESSGELTKTDMDNIINKWVNLEVTKGELIPMIIQKVTTTGTKTVDQKSNYYSKPCHPNDNPTDNKYEYWAAVAYRTAPFTKNKGEPYIYDDTITGIDYTHVKKRPDSNDTRGDQFIPKIGPVETTDEDKYAIYNDVANKLKDKKFPNVTVNVDVANYKNGKFNDYQLWDKVYLKLPGYNELITARVNSISKSSNDVAENNVTLGTYSINTTTPQNPTIIYGDNVNFNYPSIGTLTVTLKDYEDNLLRNKLLTFNITSNDQNTSPTQVFNVLTNQYGVAKIEMGYTPGTYNVEVYYSGDEIYESCNSTYEVSVGGTLEKSVKKETPKANKNEQKKDNNKNKTDKKNKNKTKYVTKTVKTYWSKYGLSPDKKRIKAIGRPSHGDDTGAYDFYEMEFKNKCPHCGKASLYWGIFYAGNETANWGVFPATGRREGGSAEGHIFCKSCDADYSCQGNEHALSNPKKLKALTKKKKSTKKDAYKLREGKLQYGTKKIKVKAKKNNKKTEGRTNPINNNISKAVREKALKIVGKKKDLAAAKEIAKFMGQKIAYEKVQSKVNNFSRSPSNVLGARMGNCCSQTRLMLELMDAAGVTDKYKLIYIHTVGGKGGHVFARIVSKKTGHGVYVDPCKANPWGNWVKGYGTIGSAPSSNYPTLPF